jgi:hypothetical protein
MSHHDYKGEAAILPIYEFIEHIPITEDRPVVNVLVDANAHISTLVYGVTAKLIQTRAAYRVAFYTVIWVAPHKYRIELQLRPVVLTDLVNNEI